jgi:AraC-like DNA-binding protein
MALHLRIHGMSVSVFLVRAVVEAVERSGVSRADLFDRITLQFRRLEEPEARLEFNEFERVLAAAVSLTGDEAFGLHMVEQISEGAVDLLAHLTAHAPTVREAVAIASQFGSLAIDGLRFAARDEGDTFVVHCAFPRSTPLCDRILAELMMGGQARLARTFVGPHVIPRLACFEHERPSHHREYTRIFGNNQRFCQTATSIAFDRELADRPQMHQHPELYALLRAEAERRLDQIASRIGSAAVLHQYLLAISPSRIPDMTSAARDLGMSERSLRRHLAAEGTSYRNVVQSALETSAGRMLRDPARTIKETAVALGFADAAAFVHAFRRWTGMTPGEYRRTRSGR